MSKRWRCLVLLLVWVGEAHALDLPDQTHLLKRLSFGVEAHRDVDWAVLSRTEAVDLLLDSVDTEISVPHPPWVAGNYDWQKVDKSLPIEAQRQFKKQRNKRRREQREELKVWWLRQVSQGASPVAERLLLFWQNYFSTEIDALPDPRLMWRQHLTLRRHALGDYRELLGDMNRDPALLWYLDNHLNKKQKPNENYARELLELYTLGEGHFDESEVKQLARIMTGAGVDKKSGRYRFRVKQHDSASKQFLGVSGALKPEQVIDIILRQRRPSEYLVERLWREFVSPSPKPQAVASLAKRFREADYKLRPLLRALFLEPDFWAPEHRNTLIQSPVEYLLELHLRVGKPLEDYPSAVEDLIVMGQDLFNPPDVGGWPSGQGWINSVRVAKRHQLALTLDPVMANAADSAAYLK